MSPIVIRIVNTLVETKMNKANKPYRVLTVDHKVNIGGQDKLDSKKLMDWGPEKNTFEVLLTAKSNEVYSVEREKDDNGYWKWLNVLKEDPAKGPVTSSSTAQPAKSASYSTYSTPEERAQTQRFIIRQSCLAQAVAVSIAAKKLDRVDIFDLAEDFVDFITLPTDTEYEADTAQALVD